MKSLKYLLMILFMSAGLTGLVEAAGIDPNIIIFSQSHGPVSHETRTGGVLKIGVTSFFKIQEITVNGDRVSVSGDSVANIEFPYQLTQGSNEFKVVVVTEKGESEKRFTINLGKKPVAGGKDFQLIGIAGVSSLDNVATASENEQSGTKLSLIVVPQYDLKMSRRAKLRLKGIILRERFSESDFSSHEISYTQVFVQWIQNKTALGDVSVGAGVNDIRTNNENPLLGEDESMIETVLSAGLIQKLSADLSWNLKFELKLRDSTEEVTSENDDADARDAGLEAGLGFKRSGIKGTARIGYSINDAMGDYVDSSTAKISARASYPVGIFVPGLGLDYKQKTRANKNASGIKQEDKTATVTAKVDYKMPFLPNSQLSLTLKSKNQTSNVSTAEYAASIITLALAYVF